MPLAADALDLAGAGADRQHDGGERGVEVGADPGGDAGALARVGVERLQAGERAGVELADVLVDGVDVGAAGLDRQRDDQPAGEVEPAAAVAVGAGGEQVAVERRRTSCASGRGRRSSGAGSPTGRRCRRRPGRRPTGRRRRATLVMARKPIAPGANGRRNSSIACWWVRAGGGRRRVWCGWAWWCSFRKWMDGVRRRAAAPGVARPASARKRDGPPVGRPPRTWRARDHELVLGARGGDVEQPPLLGEVLGVGALERAPGRQQLLLAARAARRAAPRCPWRGGSWRR